MIIPDAIRDSVCFAYIRVSGNDKPVGTAFFLGIPLPDTGRFGCLVVTALHVVAKAQTHSDDGCLYLRVNVTGGAYQFVKVEADQWARPDQTEQAVDVAAAIWPFGRDRFDFRFVTPDQCATPEVVSSYDIGIGNEVFLAGLFVSHHGKQRNVPIVRVGSIASMPLEPVSTRLGALEAYLVEARSVGGLSGSPVYVRTEAWREDENHQFHPRFGGNAWHLLGIMHGHWQAPMEDVAVDDGLSTEYVNMGIAVVTPIDKLLELVEQPPLSAVLAGMTRTTREGLQAASEHVERGADRLTTEA